MALSTPNRHAASHGLEPAAHVIVRAAVGTAERRLFARALLRRKRLRFATVADREAAPDHLLAAVMHVASEQDQMDQELGATSGGDSITEFVQRSRLFRTRGLSLDTSLRPNYAVEQALAMSNVEAMVKPGAFLLANVSAPNLTSVTIRPVDTTTTLYTRARDVRQNILDFIVWYEAHAN